MEIIGFLALLIFGCYLAFASVALFIVSMGFAGKFPLISIPILIIALVVLYFAFTNAPFTIAFN